MTYLNVRSSLLKRQAAAPAAPALLGPRSFAAPAVTSAKPRANTAPGSHRLGDISTAMADPVQRMSLKQHAQSGGLQEMGDAQLEAKDGPTRGWQYVSFQSGAKSRAEALKMAMLTVRQVGIAAESTANGRFLAAAPFKDYLVKNENGDRYKLGEWLTGYPLEYDDKDYQAEQRASFNKEYLPKLLPQDELERFRDEREFSMFLDPFQLDVWVAYDDRYKGNTLRIVAEFGYGYKGYIVRVEDDLNQIAANMKVGPKQATDAGVGMPNTFSSTHHSTSGSSQQLLIDAVGTGESLATNEAGIDAYTKVVGEGARWHCVGELGTKVHDGTVFYYKKEPAADAPDATSVWAYLTFVDLWANWKVFGSKFGIPDDEVIEQMQNKPQTLRVKETTTFSTVQGGYDLDG